ncbi:MAG: NAD(P)/FAD-dependent oxidoreductase [Gemmatimonadota bacterium]|jgi:NADH dehydrogenase
MSDSQGARPRVVVCGAGFGGLWAARRLMGEPVEVTLLDRNNYHTFYPLLYQVAAAELGPTDIAYPVRSILRTSRNVHFRMADVRGLDLGERAVITDLERIPYDHLVLALGSVPNDFGVEGVAEHAFFLREMDQAIPLRHHILSRFESAVYERREARRRRMLTFAIVGGGPTGVEFAGALAELIHGPLLKDYPTIDPEEVRVVLLEAMDRVLLAMPEELGAYAAERLRSRRVRVRTGAVATRVTAEAIHFEDGEPLGTETVVWTAGVQGPAYLEEWGLSPGRGSRVRVDPNLGLPGHPEVRVIGDMALTDEDDPLPQVAPVAVQQGEHAAENILRDVRGEEPRPFRYQDPGMLAVIGRNAAVADFGKRTFTGFPAWILWLSIHVAKLIGFRNRLLVLVNWAWNYISYERAVRLILPSEPEERVEKDVPKPATPSEEVALNG